MRTLIPRKEQIMTVLITGGTGLVGSRLLPRLVAAKIDCRVLVRAGIAAPAGVTAVEGDLLNPASLVWPARCFAPVG